MMEPIDFEEYKREYFRKKALKKAKRKRRFFSFILPALSVLLILGTIGTALGMGLSAYFAEQRYYTFGYQIEECTYTVNEEGETIVTVTFENDALEPVVFTVEKGILGDDGNAVSSIECTSDTEDYLTFTINYSDPDLEPTVFSFPLQQGKDGRFVTGIEVSYDREHRNTPTIIFHYSDGTSSEPITLPDGFSSQYGVSISAINIGEITSDGSTPVALIFSNESWDNFEFYILKGVDGEDGATIRAITTSQDDSFYYINFYFVGNNTETPDYSFSIPFVDDATNWYYGTGNPNNNSYVSTGVAGDFYFDTANDVIYYKETGTDGVLTWVVVFEVHGEGVSHPDYCLVTYDLNGGVWSETGLSNTMMSSVKYGDYAATSFSSLGTPYLEGKTFMGWYSYSDYGNPNAGKLDSLTPIVGDITVYAWFE